MATCTLQNIFDDARGYLSDTQIVGGEIFTNNYLAVHFAEPYRTMFKRLVGGSKRVQRVVEVVLPAYTSVLIPSTYGIVDFGEPEMIEERPAPTGIAITSTNTATPIQVNAPGHGLSNNAEGVVSGVLGTDAPWGNWFITYVDANNFTLNGSASDGVAGTGGFFYPENNQQYTDVSPIDLSAAGIDGLPQQVLGVYMWRKEQLSFRGASNAIELRITYYASGTAPSNPNYTINIDDCRDFLGVATAANAARSKQWWEIARELRSQAYGDPTHPDEPSLIDLFFSTQVLASQRGPARRQQPFRDKRYKFGSYVAG